jgi:drug/metabolite transporter (DMT)-like permease
MRTNQAAGPGLGAAGLSAALFGTSGSFATSLIGAGWSPAAAVTARVGIAAAVLALPTAIAMRGRWALLRQSVGLIAAFGLLAVGGAQYFYFQAVAHLSVGVALLLEYLGIVLVVGWLWVRHGKQPRRLTVIGSVVAAGGLVLVLDLLGKHRLDPVGVLWGLAAAVGLAAYFLISARGNTELPPVALASTGMAVGTAALLLLGAVGVLPMHATTRAVRIAGQHTSWLVPVVGLSLVAAVAAYLFGIHAARVLGATLASFVGLAEVLFAVFFAWLLLGQVPTGVQIGGGSLIVAGIALVRIDELRPVVTKCETERPTGAVELEGARP